MLEGDTRGAYRARDLVGRLINRLKQCRRMATRYDKTARNQFTYVALAAIHLRAKFGATTPSP